MFGAKSLQHLINVMYQQTTSIIAFLCCLRKNTNTVSYKNTDNRRECQLT